MYVYIYRESTEDLELCEINIPEFWYRELQFPVVSLNKDTGLTSSPFGPFVFSVPETRFNGRKSVELDLLKLPHIFFF